VLNGMTVLLVEDSLIIALDAEDIVTVGSAPRRWSTAATVDGALEMIEAATGPSGDARHQLGDRNSFPIADRLMELNVPFIFATGYGEQAQLPRSIAPAPWCRSLTRSRMSRARSTGWSGRQSVRTG
jgi:hypothetical protein